MCVCGGGGGGGGGEVGVNVAGGYEHENHHIFIHGTLSRPLLQNRIALFKYS